MEADDIVVDQPAIAALLVAAVATVAYVGIQLVVGGGVSPVETGIFVIVFTAVYMGGNWYLRRRERDDADGGATSEADGDTTSPESPESDGPA